MQKKDLEQNISVHFLSFLLFQPEQAVVPHAVDMEHVAGMPYEYVEDSESTHSTVEMSDHVSTQETEYVNPRGVRFTAQQPQGKEGNLLPQGCFGIETVRKLFAAVVYQK